MLGKRELRGLLKWRDALRTFIDQSDAVAVETGSESADSEGESELKRMNMELSQEKRQKKRRERREVLKRKLKLAESIRMFPGGVQDMSHSDVPLFNISAIRSRDQLRDMLEGNVEPPPEERTGTRKTPLSRHDWDMRDEEEMPTTLKSGTAPPEDTKSDSSDDEEPLLTEVIFLMLPWQRNQLYKHFAAPWNYL